MSTKYDAEIQEMELRYKLEGQKNALTRVDLECLRLRKKLDDYDETKVSLTTEIAKTEQEITALRGGETNG